MTRFLPSPLGAAALLAIWLLLNESLEPGIALLGAGLALGGARMLRRLEVPKPRLRRPLAAVRLAFLVLIEIVRSNAAVAQIILGRRSQARSGFVRIPLEMRNPYGLTTLACIITATPGTLWVEYESAGNTILLHVLDLVDDETWIRTIKDRYESRLMDIFE
jgi:multicomponent K+:H+ antiporter subunit E